MWPIRKHSYANEHGVYRGQAVKSLDNEIVAAWGMHRGCVVRWDPVQQNWSYVVRDIEGGE